MLRLSPETHPVWIRLLLAEVAVEEDVAMSRASLGTSLRTEFAAAFCFKDAEQRSAISQHSRELAEGQARTLRALTPGGFGLPEAGRKAPAS